MILIKKMNIGLKSAMLAIKGASDDIDICLFNFCYGHNL